MVRWAALFASYSFDTCVHKRTPNPGCWLFDDPERMKGLVCLSNSERRKSSRVCTDISWATHQPSVVTLPGFELGTAEMCLPLANTFTSCHCSFPSHVVSFCNFSYSLATGVVYSLQLVYKAITIANLIAMCILLSTAVCWPSTRFHLLAKAGAKRPYRSIELGCTAVC